MGGAAGSAAGRFFAAILDATDGVVAAEAAAASVYELEGALTVRETVVFVTREE